MLKSRDQAPSQLFSFPLSLLPFPSPCNSCYHFIMSVLSLNCQRVGTKETICYALKNALHFSCDPLLFLIETKKTVSEMDLVRPSPDFQGSFVSNCVSRRKGLALLWKTSWSVRVLSKFECHIDVVMGEGDFAWHLTGFYSHTEVACLAKSWALLRLLAAASDLPWLVFRNFNEIVSNQEKRGRYIRTMGWYFL